MSKVFAIANCRVSSDEQLQNNSLNRQRQSVVAAAERLGVEIADDGWWSGSVSSKKGNNLKRKDIQEMLEYCERNKSITYLIVDEPDRFMRSIDEALYLEMEFKLRGVKVWYASDDVLNSDDMTAKLMKFMKYFVAEGSNEERQRKSINGQTAALKEGRWTFVPKPGYMKGKLTGVPEIHPVRGKELQRNLKKLAAGYFNPTRALIELNKTDFTQDHSPYKMDKYRKVATDIFYAGIIEMDVQVKVSGIEGLYEPLITIEEHYRLVEIFNNKPKYQLGPKRNGNPKFPLNNLMEHRGCTELKNKGRLVGYDHTNGKYKKIYQKYRCRSCNKYWHKQDVDSEIVDLFSRYEMSTETKEKITNALELVWAQDRKSQAEEMRLIKLKIANLEKNIEQKVESATDVANSFIKDDILRLIGKKKDELSDLEDQLLRLNSGEQSDKREFIRFALGFIQNTGNHFLEPYLTKEHRIMCKQMLFPGGIYINPDGKVYTPKVSTFYRDEVNKKDAEASDNSHLVRVMGL